MAEKLEFPTCVGPFTLSPVNLAPAINGFYQQFRDFPRPDPASHENLMAGLDLSRLGWGMADVVFAQFSPLHRLTLDSEAKQAASMPEAAEFFAWAYPAVLEGGVPSRASPSEKGFLDFGGYVYFNSSQEVVGCSSIVPAPVGTLGLSFGRPQPLPDKASEVLTQQGRFQEVSLSFLTSRGATHFAWIRPGEFDEAIANPNGSFAYKFAGRPTKYYPVVTKPVFTKGMLEEDLDDSEAWVVVRVSSPPTMDKLLILDKSCPLEELPQRCPDAVEELSSPKVQGSGFSIYREETPETKLTFQEWQSSTEQGEIGNPWIFELPVDTPV